MSSISYQKPVVYTKKTTLYSDYKRQTLYKSSSCKDFYHISPSNTLNMSKEKTIVNQYKDKGKYSRCNSSSYRIPSANQSNSSVHNITNDIITSPFFPKEFKKKLSRILLDTLSNSHIDYDKYKTNKPKHSNTKIKLQKEEIMKILNNSNSKFHQKLKLTKPTNYQKSIILNKPSEANKSFYDKSFRKTIGHNNSLIFQQYKTNQYNPNECRKDFTLDNSKSKMSKRSKGNGNKSNDIRFTAISKASNLCTIQQYAHNPPSPIMAYHWKPKNSFIKASFHKEIKATLSKTCIEKQVEFKVPIKELIVNDCFTFRKVDFGCNNNKNNNTHRSTSENGSHHNTKEVDQLMIDTSNNNSNRNRSGVGRAESYNKRCYFP